MTIVYPGSFDPPTMGHIALIKRAAKLYDRVIVLVIANPNKQAKCTIEQRAQMIRTCVGEIANVSVQTGTGLLVEAVESLGGDAILRGVRGEVDYAAERPIAELIRNRYSIETVFMQGEAAYDCVSSSIVRELAGLGADISGLVPGDILLEINKAYA